MSEVMRYYAKVKFDGNSKPYVHLEKNNDGNLVFYSDIEKMVKLWEMMKPRSFICCQCQNNDDHGRCVLFNEYPITRTQQCIDIFGGDV